MKNFQKIINLFVELNKFRLGSARKSNKTAYLKILSMKR